MTGEEKDPAVATEGKAEAMGGDEVPLVEVVEAIDAKAEDTAGEEAVMVAGEAVEEDTEVAGVNLTATEVQLQLKRAKRSMLR